MSEIFQDISFSAHNNSKKNLEESRYSGEVTISSSYSPDQWPEIRDRIRTLSEVAFSLFPAEVQAYLIDEQDWHRTDSDTVRLIATDTAKGSIAGYQMAINAREADLPFYDVKEHGDHRIAYVKAIAIDPEYRNQGLATKLTRCLDNELRDRGYQYISSLIVDLDGWGDKVDHLYGAKLIERTSFRTLSGLTLIGIIAEL